MPGRSCRATKGQLPKHLENYVVNMSGSSTPMVGNNDHASSSNDSSLNNTIVEPNNDGNEMITSLMNRLRVLEEQNKSTTQQLLQSEVKRLQLLEKLSLNNVITSTAVTNASNTENTIVSNNATINHMPQVTTNVTDCNIQRHPITSANVFQPIQSTSLSNRNQHYLSTEATSNNINYTPTYTQAQFLPTYNTMPYPMFTHAACSHSQTGNLYTNAGSARQLPSNVFANRHMNVSAATRKLYELPDFSGCPEQWPVFITAFNESSRAYQYTDLENTFRLQKCLKGSAREDVECLLINPTNVSQVIEQLEFKYGRAELLVRSQLQKVREIIPVPENRLDKLVPFATKVQNLTIFLKSCNAIQHLSNPTLMEEIINKMPMTKRIEWSSYSSTILPYPTLEHFNAWINQIAKVIARVTPIFPINPVSTVMKNNAGQTRTNTKPIFTMGEVVAEDVNKKSCVKCRKAHLLFKCEQFLELTVDERWNFVKCNRLCFACLNKGHSLLQCRRKRNCNIDGCKKFHNVKLHKNLPDLNVQVNMIDRKSISLKTTNLLYKIVPIELCGPNGETIKTHAFLDEGSSSTIIHEPIAHQLGCRGKMDSLTLRWFDGEPKTVPSMSIKIQIKGVSKGNKCWHRLNARSVPELELPVQSVNISELHDKFHELKNLPISGYTEVMPRVLIGLDNCHLTPNLKSIQLNRCVIAANTPLGWVIYGRPEGSRLISACQLSVILHTKEGEEDSIERLVSDYFTTENFGVAMPEQSIESDRDKRARQILKHTTRRMGSHYETGLLWKADDIRMPESLSMALNRFYSIERKMEKDVNFSEAYKRCMKNYIDSGYAKKLSGEEINRKSVVKWYLPHFAVYNVNKPNKLRLVFDAAATVNGTSLNSQLLKGPDENQPLLKILFHFREGSIAVCSDIREMFLQIRIRETDQDAQRFIWRFDKNAPVDTYCMVSMIFGAACSPCSAQYVKNINALKNSGSQPEVIDAIVNSHYVDDMVCSFDDETKALEVSSAIKNTHLKGGFELRGFISNSPNVQRKLNGNIMSEPTDVNMNNADSVEKVLGLFWGNDRDEFLFKLQMNRVDPAILNGDKCPTKRELLSLVMSVFDPFGILANLLIYGKVLLQELWQKGVGWDETIPSDIYGRLVQWIANLQTAKNVRLPRCYSSQFLSAEEIELHIFNDASETAFASVAYWRIVNKDRVCISFVAGKTKCAPLKVLSVPRLELQAAVMGTRLKNMIIGCHRIQPARTILWTDSKTVISWIKSDHRQYKAFVMHRVGEILESTNTNEWRWLPTKFNVDDVATRTSYPINYSPNNDWLQGPSFLLNNDSVWPPPAVSNEPSTREERRKFCMVTLKTEFIKYNNFSSYNRLLRTIAWVMRFIKSFRRGSKCCYANVLSASEVQQAEITLCKLVQKEMYANEINEIRSNGHVISSSSIASFTPQLDENGLICVYGRVDHAIYLPERSKHPIILPKGHHVTELIIMWYHCKYFHQNDELIVNEIRRMFWIPYLRAAVKSIKYKCQQCKNNRVKPIPPMMGQLPIDRLQPYVRPFTYTGLDYFGPMYVTIGRGREKRWAALFTCLTTRAMHIELASDLSTDACIICIRNFVNRRGIPVRIRSDMGTNFVGTDGEFKRTTDLFDYKYIENELSVRKILWEFNCPANPSSGGCWERLVQTTKRVLAITLKESAPQVETLRSLLIEAENIVNSRPLTHLPVTPDDPEPLTPNHFLLGTTNSTQTPYYGGPICSRKQYRISQQLKNRFWRRWVREYLPTLTRRTKWFRPQKPVEINDLVIICDENQPRSQWRRGIITKRFTAKDGTTRVVEVTTTSGVLRRPVSKLAVLDVSGEFPRDIHRGRDVAAEKETARFQH